MRFSPGVTALLAASVVVFFTTVGIIGTSAAQQDQDGGASTTRSVRDGVYSTAQAERGGMVFSEHCTECHTPRMWSSEWDGSNLGALYEFISTFMPEPAPGSLSPRQVRDVIAYFLEMNGLPAGSVELPETTDALKLIRLEKASAK